jgi:hypothetical protein
VESLIYRIEVRGQVPARVLEELAGFTVEVSPRATVLSGPMADSAALYGLIARFETLGLTLVSVRPKEEDDVRCVDQPSRVDPGLRAQPPASRGAQGDASRCAPLGEGPE